MLHPSFLKIYTACAVVCLAIVFFVITFVKPQISEDSIVTEQTLELSINGHIRYLTIPRDVTIHIIANELGELTDIQCFNRTDGIQRSIIPATIPTTSNLKWPTNKPEN